MASVSLAFALSIMGVRDVRAGMDDVGDGADNAASRLSALGAAGVAAAGLLAGAFGAGLVSALDIEPAIDKMNASLGATGADAQRFGDVAGKLYAGAYGESFDEVSAGLTSLVGNISGAAEMSAAELEKIGGAAFDVATIMGEDVGRVTVAVGQMMKTGLAANAEEAFDILAVGQQRGLNRAEDLLDVIEEYSVQFQRVGLDGQTAMGLISQGLQAGARDADQVSDAIGQFGERALAGGKPVEDAFTSIGLNAAVMAAEIGKGGGHATGALQATMDALRGTSDEQVKLNAAAALFGDPGNVLGAALFALDPATAAASAGMADVSGAAARMGETLNDNARTNLTEFKRQAEMALVNLLGEHVVPAITKATGWLSDNFGPALEMVGGWLAGAGRALQDFSGWLRDNETTIKIVAGIITAIYLPALIQMGVQAVVSGAMAAGAWVMMQIRALAAAALMLPIFALQVAQWVAIGMAATTSAARQAAAWVASKAQAAASVAVQLGALAATGARWVWAGTMAMVNAARMAAAWIISLGPIAWVIAAVAAAVALIIKYWDDIVKGLKAAGKAIADFFTALPGWIMDFLSAAGEWLVDAGRAILGGLLAGLRWYFDNVIKRFWWDIPTAILELLADSPSWLVSTGADILLGLLRGAAQVAGTIRDWLNQNVFQPIWGGIRRLFGIGSPATAMLGLGADIIRGLLAGAWNVASGIGDWLQRNLKDPVFRFFAGAGRWLWQKGDDLIRGMVGGMWGVLAGIVGWLRRNVYDRIVNGIKSLFGINSPSTVMAGLGVHLIEGLLRGIVFSSRNVGAVVKKALGGIVDAAGGIFGLIGGAGGKLFDIIFGGDGGGKIGRIAGGVQRWAGIASAVLAELGQSQRWLPTLLRRMNQESGGNPRAINLWDSNAKRGDPSRGLMQTIGGTFNAYAGKYAGRGIYDPYANIYAATRYTLARYGTLAAWNRPGGYDQGGWLQPGWTLALNKTGSPELVVPMDRLRQGGDGGGAHYHYEVHLHGTVVLGGSRDRAGKELRELFRDSLRGDGKMEAAAML